MLLTGVHPGVHPTLHGLVPCTPPASCGPGRTLCASGPLGGPRNGALQNLHAGVSSITRNTTIYLNLTAGFPAV